MKRMSSLAYHFGAKLRFYPSSKQKKIIKLNYDAQRFVYNSYVEHSYQKMLQAFALNKTVPDASVAKKILDDMIPVNAP